MLLSFLIRQLTGVEIALAVLLTRLLLLYRPKSFLLITGSLAPAVTAVIAALAYVTSSAVRLLVKGADRAEQGVDTTLASAIATAALMFLSVLSVSLHSS